MDRVWLPDSPASLLNLCVVSAVKRLDVLSSALAKVRESSAGVWIRINFCGSISSCLSQCRSGSRCGSGPTVALQFCVTFKLCIQLYYDEFALIEPHH